MNYVVKELYIYPIKSLAGISVDCAKAEEMGFENDRRWMLIDQENQFITQRNHPCLSQFYPKIDGNKISISYQDKAHDFFTDETLDQPLHSKVWDDDVQVFEVNVATSKWFSEALGFECKLVKINTVGDRKHKSTKLKTSLNVSLADGYPYLLIGSESLSFLNNKLEEKICINRFRPNIVISSQLAHEEDFFDSFQIEKVKFVNAKPCGRCVMINTNPASGFVNKEPLNTLSTYRKKNNSVLFGVNLMCLGEGEISIGSVLVF